VDSLLEQPPSPPVAAPAAEPEPVTEAVAMPPDWIPEAPMQSEQLPFLDGPSMAPSSGPAGPPPIRLPLFTLLLPRYSEHELTGELAERLRSWTTRLCLAWDWVAERIEVLPDRLEITLILPPDESPAHAVQELRDGLSERVLRSFPELALDLPSRRFWSSSYLLRAGPAPPSGEIEAFVRETRLAQTGLTIA
jgi:REP element-mobilizing transposase RayT